MVWKSQLISKICLPTAHSEYVALTLAVKAVIPIRETIIDALKFFKLPSDKSPKVYCKLFEDNQTAYLLANEQRLSNNTKYYNLKYHWFLSHVFCSTRNPSGWLRVILRQVFPRWKEEKIQ